MQEPSPSYLRIAARALIIGAALLLPPGRGPLAAKEPRFSAAQVEFFESKIRPLLAKHCFECHSEKAKKIQGGLRLDARELAIKGGDNGAALAPGKPKESLLLKAVRWESFEMPPKGKLPKGQVELLARWIEQGAPWPAGKATSASANQKKSYDWAKLQSEHWAFRPVAPPAPPNVGRADWPLNEIDRFVLARLEANGLAPAPAAEPRVLIRRLHFDLIGLPPTPQRVERFVKAMATDRDGAISGLVDELLSSKHYGERWGRHWLDIARYSDGFGGFSNNAALPHAWRYRDWLISALNDDLPFDRFVKMQIAGDLIDPENAAVATGFFALGPSYNSDGGDPDSVAQARGETLDDRVDTLTRGLLALTVSCARCHAHKFDPIPQGDYYSLAGVFNNTAIHVAPLGPKDVVKKFDDHQRLIQNLEKRVKQRNDQLKKEKRAPTEEEKEEQAEWAKQLDELRKTLPPKYDVAHALIDRGSSDMKIAIRGDLRKPGEVAPRRFLRVLSRSEAPRFTKGSGRLELADAIADPSNPLTARVFVNRVWMHHFGEALVRSPSNFGALGTKPSHPALLDFLADRFVRSGWSIKKLHRLIVMSATYRMSSRFNSAAFEADGANHLLWRKSPRRLDVESWRDALLSVTGELDRTIGGPPIEDPSNRRRTVYFKSSRNGDRFASDFFLRLFDFPLMRATVAKRPVSVVPQQFLFLMNSDFMTERGKALAARLERERKSEAERINFAYALLYGRKPTENELQLGLSYLQTEGAGSRWQQYAQVLLSANEFMYVR